MRSRQSRTKAARFFFRSTKHCADKETIAESDIRGIDIINMKKVSSMIVKKNRTPLSIVDSVAN